MSDTCARNFTCRTSPPSSTPDAGRDTFFRKRNRIVHSLRWKLVAGILGGMTVLLGAGGTVAYFNIRQQLYAEFDRSLVQRTVLLASMIEQDAGAIKIEWLENGTSPPGHQPGIDYFSVWTKERSDALAASPDLERGSLPRLRSEE